MPCTHVSSPGLLRLTLLLPLAPFRVPNILPLQLEEGVLAFPQSRHRPLCGILDLGLPRTRATDLAEVRVRVKGEG